MHDMATPELRYTYTDGRKASDFVAFEAGEAIIDARLVQYPDGNQAWFDRSGLKLAEIQQHHGQETNQSATEGSQSDGRVQTRDAEKRQAGSRKGSNSKKPQAGNSHCTI
mgnify:CR=1 FL=1